MTYRASRLPDAAPARAAPIEERGQDVARVNRALRTLSAGNHTLLHASDEQQLLHDMCRVMVEKGAYCFSCVAYAQYDEDKTIRWMASFGIETDYLNTFHFTWGESGQGSTATGTAIRTGRPSVGRNLLTDPIYADPSFIRLRADAAKRGYAAATAIPLYLDGKVLGALTLAALEPDAFDDDEMKLLLELAADLAYGIDNLRVRVKHREAQAAIARLAYFDTLTGLANRTQLLERLDDAIQSARQQQHSLALLYMESAICEELNKVFGYRAGDQLLKELGQRMGQTVRDGATLARVGETGFALLLPRSDAESAVEVARQLARTLHDPVEIAGVMVDGRAGIGIALFPGHGACPEALLRRARAALIHARPAAGGYAMYRGGQEEINTRRLALMADLRRAIDKNELFLHFQPKVDIASHRLCGAEALVRWQHPQHGLIPTIEFVKLAEQAGLIAPLTNWVLDAAFHQCYAWHEAGMDHSLAINLSAHDLRDPKLVDRIRGLFSTWGIGPELIQFELTESAMMEDPAGSLETLARLKQLDTKLLVDDFGTGYSSLSYLQKLPVDFVKIDQSFVTPMMTSGESAVIVRAAIELSHNLNLGVVAEGVERQETLDRLSDLGCDVAQGYLISRPISADQFQAWGKEWSLAAH